MCVGGGGGGGGCKVFIGCLGFTVGRAGSEWQYYSQFHYLICPQTFVKSHHKVGVLRVKQGQRSEEEVFCNEHEPGAFDEFLRVLGKCAHTMYLPTAPHGIFTVNMCTS